VKAVQVTAPGAIEIADVPEPDGGRDAVLEVNQVGICGTDVKILEGKIPIPYPMVAGHEMLGEIVQPAEGFPYAAGDRMLVDPGVSCGFCDLCVAGRTNICRNGGLLGRDVDGVFTEYVVVPGNRLVPVPDTVSDKAGGLLQVLGTCVHAAKVLDPFPGRVAAVLGLGVTGQLLSQLLRLQGYTVVGITRSEWKRELAQDLGAAVAAEPARAAEVLADVTSGLGPDLVVEAVGTEATLAQAIDLAAIGGEVLVFGTITGGGEGLPYYQLYYKELTLHNPRAAVLGDYADGVQLAAAGSIQLEPLVTHMLDLEEAETAFDLVSDSSSLKVLMQVG
jgi:2-desacetyl-2-hydroxyethyl bacteriochlorophyllide A dehydrogenase